MKSILVPPVEGYSRKSAVIIATMEKIREIKELVERVLDLGRLWGH